MAAHLPFFPFFLLAALFRFPPVRSINRPFPRMEGREAVKGMEKEGGGGKKEKEEGGNRWSPPFRHKAAPMTQAASRTVASTTASPLPQLPEGRGKRKARE